MTADILIAAAELLEDNAAALCECSTVPGNPEDWGVELDAKEDYEKEISAAAALRSLAGPSAEKNVPQDPIGNLLSLSPTEATILAQAHRLIADAESAGVVVRIDLVARMPLTMGNYEMVVDVRLGHAGAHASMRLQ